MDVPLSEEVEPFEESDDPEPVEPLVPESDEEPESVEDPAPESFVVPISFFVLSSPVVPGSVVVVWEVVGTIVPPVPLPFVTRRMIPAVMATKISDVTTEMMATCFFLARAASSWEDEACDAAPVAPSFSPVRPVPSRFSGSPVPGW